MKDIYALGIHIGHDRCAALVKNGELQASLAQERIDRIKHSDSSEIPYQAIDAILDYCQITVDMIDYVALMPSSMYCLDCSRSYSFSDR